MKADLYSFMQGSFIKIQDLIGYVSKYMLMRPKSDFKIHNQLMQIMFCITNLCRLCSDMDENASANSILKSVIIAKYVRRMRICMRLKFKVFGGQPFLK